MLKGSNLGNLRCFKDPHKQLNKQLFCQIHDIKLISSVCLIKAQMGRPVYRKKAKFGFNGCVIADIGFPGCTQWRGFWNLIPSRLSWDLSDVFW